MISLNVFAGRDQSSYLVDVKFAGYALDIKIDTGAVDTVISFGAVEDDISPPDFETFKNYCENHYSSVRKRFTSASGGSFYGYPISVKDAKIGGVELPVFVFYLVLENRRDIALLGFDFIDRCTFSHKVEGDLILTEFDEDSYGTIEGAMGTDELISLIDSLSSN